MNIWKIRFEVNSYYIFDEEFSMNKFKFFKIGNQNYAICIVEANSVDEAEEGATKELNNTLKMIEFITDEKFTCTLNLTEQEILPREGVFQYLGAAYLPSEITIKKPFRKEILYETDNLNNLLKGANKTGKVAYECYLKGLEIYQWNTEAFLNFFKSIETISEQYLDKGKEEKKVKEYENYKKLTEELKEIINKDKMKDDEVNSLIKQIYSLGFVEVRKRIELTIKDLDVNVDKKKLDKIVKLRPKVAHGGSVQNVKEEDLEDCKCIAKEVIISYIKKYRKD